MPIKCLSATKYDLADSINFCLRLRPTLLDHHPSGKKHKDAMVPWKIVICVSVNIAAYGFKALKRSRILQYVKIYDCKIPPGLINIVLSPILSASLCLSVRLFRCISVCLALSLPLSLSFSFYLSRSMHWFAPREITFKMYFSEI